MVPALSGQIGTPSLDEMKSLCEGVGIKPTAHTLILIREILDADKNPRTSTILRVMSAHQKLREIQRFRGLTMHFRDTVGMHVERVEKMITCAQHALAKTFPKFPFEIAWYIASQHDITEGLSPLGDIPTPNKRNLSPALTSLLQRIERRGFEIIAELPDLRALGEHGGTFSRENAQWRLEFFQQYEKREEPWAQVIKYFDILDAYMEILVEVHEHNNVDFIPLAARYRGDLAKIASGELLPAIQKIYQNKRSIQAWIDELFGTDERFPHDNYAEQYAGFSGGLGLFDFDDLQGEKPKAFEYWKKHIFRPFSQKRPHNLYGPLRWVEQN